MENPLNHYPRNINAFDLVVLAKSIAALEDEFKICLTTRQADKAALIEQQLCRLYRRLMHEVKRGLVSIDLYSDPVKVTFRQSDLSTEAPPTRQQQWLKSVI